MTANYPNLSEKKRNFLLLAVFISSLVLKIAVFYFATDPIIFNKYPFFAEKMSAGMPIGERILDLSPAYLYISVLFYKIFGSNWEALALFQILLGSLNGLVVYAIGQRTFGHAAGIMAAAMLMLYGNMTLIELTLEPETFVIFFNSLAVLALLEAGARCTPKFRSLPWLPAGLIIGLAAVTKANALLILPGAFIWILYTAGTWGNRLRAAAFVLLGAALLIAPVTARNYIQFNDFVLITADGGKVFFHGNGPGATGMERADLPDQGFIEEGQPEPDYAHALFRKVARAESSAYLKPAECSRFWVARTISHIQANLGDALLLEWKKFCLFWNHYEVHDLDSTYKNHFRIRGWPLIPFGMISALGILGMAVTLTRFRQAFLLYWMVFIYLLSVLVFFAASRYRIPAAPFLCLFASGFLVRLYCLWQQKNSAHLVRLALFIPVLLVWSYIPYHSKTKQFDRWQQASRIHYSLGGKTLFAKGQYRESISEFEKVISIDPGFSPAFNYLGKAHAILGDYDKALDCFRRVIQLSPAVDEGYLNMGLLLELRGEAYAAKSYFEKALTLNPNNTKAKFHLEILTAS
jgi:tetratricopeptide (TPR) repeat protein